MTTTSYMEGALIVMHKRIITRRKFELCFSSSAIVLAILCAVLLINGCSKDISNPEGLITEDASLYTALEVNHRALMLSIHPPYDTVTLKTLPLGAKRVLWRPSGYTDAEFDSILKANPPRFVSRDSSRIRVTPGGKVIAVSPTPITGTVMVIASRQINNMTWSCTTQVRALDILDPPKIVSFTLSMQDSNKVAANSFTMPVITASDEEGRPIANINTYYFSNQSKTIHFGSYRSSVSGGWNARLNGYDGIMGSTLVTASAYVYGTPVSDSIIVRNGYPVTATTQIYSSLIGGVFPSKVVGPGVTINWINSSNQVVDIIFEEPEKVLEAISPNPTSGSGNVMLIPGDSTLSIGQRQRFRRILLPGTYLFRVEPLGYTGSFIVKEF